MEIKEQSILFFTRTMGEGGTEKVVLQLCEIFADAAQKIVVCSCGGRNVGKLEEKGIRHYEIPDIEEKKPSVIRQTASVLKDVIEREKITVIHTHHRMAAFYVALLGLYKKCVFINTCHNTFYNKKFFTRYAYKKAYLITCGKMVKKNLVQYFKIPAESVTVIYNAVKPFTGKAECDSLLDCLHNKGNFIIGNVGRLTEQKGMEYYLRAIPLVLERHPDTAFLIIGTGEDEEQLKTLTKDLEIKDNVFFMGYRSDIRSLMSQMDLVVLSSLWEGLPLTPIEAFSVGKTVVATAVDGTVEIVEDDENGLLVQPKDYRKLSEKLLYLIENKAVLKNMEIKAYDCYKHKFSFENLAEQYIDFYNRL